MLTDAGSVVARLGKVDSSHVVTRIVTSVDTRIKCILRVSLVIIVDIVGAGVVSIVIGLIVSGVTCGVVLIVVCLIARDIIISPKARATALILFECHCCDRWERVENDSRCEWSAMKSVGSTAL